MESNYSNLQKSILKTLAFFDIFDYPLTLVEVYKWLYQPIGEYSLYDISQELQGGALSSLVSSADGFYFLSGRQAIIKTRLRRYQMAEKKYQIALRAATFLRWIAFVRMIAVCNNVGYNNGSKDSDIDFFIIVKQGRLWWSRLAITLVTTLLGIRRHGIKVVDRVCLSFYTADNHLNLSDISLKPIDPYLVYWLATLAPIYNRDTYDQFMESNYWLKDYLPNYHFNYLNNRRSVKDVPYVEFFRNLDKFILQGRLGDYLEKISQLIERKRLKSFFGASANRSNTNVVMSDSMLKLHKTDRREIYKNIWKEKLSQLGI